MPEYAEKWLCDKPVSEEKVAKNTKCEIVCLEGHDFLKGKWLKQIADINVFILKENDVHIIGARKAAIGKSQKV